MLQTIANCFPFYIYEKLEIMPRRRRRGKVVIASASRTEGRGFELRNNVYYIFGTYTLRCCCLQLALHCKCVHICTYLRKVINNYT
jgi:hypothetical protein